MSWRKLYNLTRVAGKFPAEFGGQCRRFWRVSSLHAKISPLVPFHISPHPLTWLLVHHATIQLSLGTRNSSSSETVRDPSNSSKTMGALDCATLTMAPRGPGGTVPLDFLNVLERTLSDLHQIDSNRIPSPILSPVFQRLYPTLMSRLDVESLIVLLSTRNSTPELPILLVSDGFTSTTTIGRKKEFDKGGSSRRRYGRAAS